MSFAEIFRGNCFKNGILTITLDKQVIDSIFSNSSLDPNLIATVDLEKLTVTTPNGAYGFDIESAAREKLLNGWDDIQLTLSKADQIRDYEKGRRESLPWLYN